MRRAFKDTKRGHAGMHQHTQAHTLMQKPRDGVRGLLSIETTQRHQEMQPADGSPLKCQPEEIAHVRKTKFQFSEIFASFPPPQRKKKKSLWKALEFWQSK